MIKQFISDYLNSMTFIFSIIILVVSVLDVVNLVEVGDMASYVLGIAGLTLVLSLIPFLLSQMNFKSGYVFHGVSFLAQLAGLFLVGRLLGYVPTFWDALINISIFSSLYVLSVRRRIYELEQLAIAMNEMLGE